MDGVRPISCDVLAPYLATPLPVVEAMLRLAEVEAVDTLLDLGCGDGRVVIAAARLCGATAIGVDCEPHWVEQATAAAEDAGVAGRVRFVCGDALTFDPGDASVVFLYLVEWSTRRVLERLLHVARPGTRVVSHSFWPQAVGPVVTETIDTGEATPRSLHLFRMPHGA